MQGCQKYLHNLLLVVHFRQQFIVYTVMLAHKTESTTRNVQNENKYFTATERIFIGN